MQGFIRLIAKILKPILVMFDFLTPLGDLVARIWVARIFFLAGIAKTMSWGSTVMLFTHEYEVPFLSPDVAAFLGTGAELLLPVLLVLGLGGRLTIFAFFIYNAIAVISYPFLLTADGAAGLYQHINWGLLLMLLMFHGPGKLSLDYWLKKRYGHLTKRGASS